VEKRTGPHGPVGTCGMMFRQDSMGQRGADAQKRKYPDGGGNCHDVEFDGVNERGKQGQWSNLFRRNLLYGKTLGLARNKVQKGMFQGG
jgi:hypothetical protein